jgi:hypothetical protein
MHNELLKEVFFAFLQSGPPKNKLFTIACKNVDLKVDINSLPHSNLDPVTLCTGACDVL